MESESGQSPEEAARNARYQVFRQLVGRNDLLMMAHHQDDQAETLLLQLLRGAGLEGISGMPEVAPFGEGMIIRPLLQYGGHQILEYAQQHGLQWVEDRSNQDPRFDRNYLRHAIIPLIEARWPSASRVLARTARHASMAAEQQRKQQQFLAEKYAPEGHFDLNALDHLDHHALRLAIRGWFSGFKLRMPSERLVTSIIDDLFGSRTDRTPMLRLPDGSQLHRYRHVAYRIPALGEAQPCEWIDWQKPLELAQKNGTISMRDHRSIKSQESCWGSSAIQIRYRIGGEKILLAGRKGHHALKDLFQEQGIPPWVRSRIPLLYIGNMLACVGDFWPNAEVINPTSWAASPHPHWLAPEDLDPTGSLCALQMNRA